MKQTRLIIARGTHPRRAEELTTLDKTGFTTADGLSFRNDGNVLGERNEESVRRESCPSVPPRQLSEIKSAGDCSTAFTWGNLPTTAARTHRMASNPPPRAFQGEKKEVVFKEKEM